jgi:hypothetical protein
MRTSKFEAMYVSRHQRDTGWLVRATEESSGRYFSTKKYGGRADAYRKAMEYAKRLTDEKRVSRKNGRWLHRRKSSGVFRFVNLKKRNKPAIWIAVASFQEGKPKRRYFLRRQIRREESEATSALSQSGNGEADFELERPLPGWYPQPYATNEKDPRRGGVHRVGDVTASGRTLPPRIWPSTAETSTAIIGTRPATTSVSACKGLL